MTGYRDDREALRDRADQLERELSAARRELQVRDVVLNHAEAEVDRLRRKAGERAIARGDEGRNRTAVIAVVSGILLMVAGGVATAALARAPAQAPVHAVAPPEPAPIPLVPEVAPSPQARSQEAAPTRLVFEGRITAVKGPANVRVGQACEILIDATNYDGHLRFDEIVVRSGPVELYRFTDGGSTVVSASSWGAGPAPDDPENRWHARFEDVGPRSEDSRPQIAFDSEREAGRVFREGVVPTEVTFSVDRLGRTRKPPIPMKPVIF